MALLLLLGACDDGRTPERRSGYAGLGQDAAAYAQVERGRPLRFPDDHGPHDGYRIEWWYVTADLRDEDGHDWGAQWTLFRSALRPGPDRADWESANVWMAHAALTDARQHQFAEKMARGGIGQAGVRAQPFHAWIDDWSLEGADIDHLTMRAHGKDFSYRLTLDSQGPLVLHGDGGYSEKSGQGQASYYYSQPFYAVTGEVERAGKRHRVQGRAWLDREWSSQPLSADQQGWDWFSLHLASGAKLMLFQVRQTDGAPYRAGTWIGADGQATPLRGEQIRLDPLEWTRQDNGRRLPTQWRVRVAGLPGGDVDVAANALQPRAWMGTSFPYWEGPVRLSPGGTGYLEMTGY
ncbi:lipocalin-like domain-containing protein [Bordetella bronchialis]|uniref:lipocalin-like domain-containing protein n=1 Tax=Bordetella bronchialis TaxID=463025 RepID=UPI001E52BCBB|nr:lipocalin-like domain-containing protein [Bordetella bronchialis]